MMDLFPQRTRTFTLATKSDQGNHVRHCGCPGPHKLTDVPGQVMPGIGQVLTGSVALLLWLRRWLLLFRACFSISTVAQQGV
ncbi:hypothetical protein SKAU_G00149020 [Synaphobranchus kaupii]|uniref:Uncharacterized protein n=1 Tax=Synaphobranchus kaupii TaxID=118154 RepID=A0A9Q1FTP6_SYNKA|nr:hypothetical protein SKAU_G00149020 [Synaphobranchus kaupii]